MRSCAWICVISACIGVIASAAEASGRADVSLAAVPKLKWVKKAPGVWMATVGTPELGPMAFAGAPRTEALRDLGEADFPAPIADARGQVRGPYASVRLPIDADEKLYGLGMRDDARVNVRSYAFELKVTPSTHAPVPFYVSSAGYGVMFNTSRVLHIYMGIGNRKDSPRLPPEIDRNTNRAWSSRPPSDAVEANAAGAGFEVYLFAGKNPLEVVQRYNLYSGGGSLPPRWALGFWHRVHTLYTADKVLAEADEFAKRDMPLDVIGLEPGWQSASYPCTYEWDAGRFPDPEAFLRAMAEKGVAVNLWINPFVSKASPLYKLLLPFTGSHLYWMGAVPDYTMDEPRRIFMAHSEKTQIGLGVSGYKLDEVDEFTPEHGIFPSGLSGEQMRQLHGMVMQKMEMDAFRRMNRRTGGLVRGSNAGGSSYPFALYSDGYSHQGFVRMLANASLAGVLWCPEVRGGKDDEDWIRRFQTMLFAPVMQLNGWSSGAKPWGKPAAADTIRALMKLRTQLLPYLYTAFAEYQRRGIPPIRHMILDSNGTSRRIERADQFMFGPSILVAPAFAGETSRQVELPDGKWFDFHTGELAGEGGTITVTPPLDKPALFVRDGGIVPVMPAVNSIRLAKSGIPLEVRHYGTRESVYVLYDDDGETFDYERGAYSVRELRAVREAGRLRGEAGPERGSWKSRYSSISWRFMTNPQ